MRQAIVNLDDHLVKTSGLEAFHEAGIIDAEMLSCEGPRGVVRLQVADEPDPDRLNDTDMIEWWEQVSDDGSGYVYLVEAGTTDPEEMIPGDGRYPLTEHIDVNGEGFTLTLTGSQERLSNEVAALEAEGADVTLKQLREYRSEETVLDSLTNRQQELLELAVDRGYYDVPRATTTKDLADEVGLDDSTVSEHLRRAERNLITSALNRTQ